MSKVKEMRVILLKMNVKKDYSTEIMVDCCATGYHPSLFFIQMLVYRRCTVLPALDVLPVGSSAPACLQR